MCVCVPGRITGSIANEMFNISVVPASPTCVCVQLLLLLLAPDAVMVAYASLAGKLSAVAHARDGTHTHTHTYVLRAYGYASSCALHPGTCAHTRNMRAPRSFRAHAKNDVVRAVDLTLPNRLLVCIRWRTQKLTLGGCA